MALRKLTDKLDNITYAELGIPFDEGLVWERLNARLDSNGSFSYRWLMVACMFLLVLLLPFTLKRGYRMHEFNASRLEKSSSLPVDVFVEDGKAPIKKDLIAPLRLEPKSVEPIEVVLVSFEMNSLNKIALEARREIVKPQYAVEDISLIQSGLKDLSGNDEKGMSIRTQLQSSTLANGDVADQSLKIRLMNKSLKKQN